MEAGIAEAEAQGPFPAQVVFDQLDGLAVGHPFGETGESIPPATPPVPGRAGRFQGCNTRPTARDSPPTPAKPSGQKVGIYFGRQRAPVRSSRRPPATTRGGRTAAGSSLRSLPPNLTGP